MKISDYTAQNPVCTFCELMLCGTDQFGRSFAPVHALNKKSVGMFYFLWLGSEKRMSGKYNITRLLKERPDDLWDTNGTPDSPVNTFHYWNEPLFGYYRSDDKWVIAKHMEMLALAGVDFLYLDATNALPYPDASRALFEVLNATYDKGIPAPKAAYYTNSHSIQTAKQVYELFYKNPEYDRVWYRPDGVHPLIIGNFTPESDAAEAALRSDSYKPEPLPEEMRAFFDLRVSQWPNEPYKKDGFPWMEWIYPQPVHTQPDGTRIMNVSLAQHPQLPFSASITDRSRNWGRGYNFETKENVEADSRKGTNFQSQWDTVLANKDKVDNVFVTGWNEWIAIKLDLGDGKPWFVDCATEEFSRDIEPMKGGYEDAFYLQLCDNIRRYKGQHDEVRLPDRKTVDINGEVSQWDGVTSVYNCVTQQSVKRTGKSVDRRTNYALDAARNNIQQVKIANDADKLYFYIKCENAVKDADKADFMNIYLGTGELALKGWNGYEYVLNCGDGSLSSLDAQGKRTRIANIEVKVSGNTVQASVSRSDIAAMEAAGIYFKVADAVSSTDIMDTYTYGKSLPMGRLSYYYYFG